MKVFPFQAALLSFSSALALSTVGHADLAENILANAPGYKPVITLSDTYSEKIVTTDGSHDIVPSQKLSAKIVANLTDFDFEGEVGDDLPVEAIIGGFDFSSTLGESAEAVRNGFPAKGKKATFPFSAEVDLPNGNTKTVKVGSIVFAWTAKTLTVTLTCTNAELAGFGEIGASQFLGLYQDDSGNRPSGSVKFSDAPIDVSVNFGSATGERLAFGKGISTTKVKRFGHGDEAEDVPTNSVTLAGTIDTAPPKVTGTVPTTDADEDGEVLFTLNVSDTPAPNGVNGLPPPTVDIFLHGSDGSDDVVSVDPTSVPDDGTGPVSYDCDVLLLAKTTTLTIVVTDASGNTTTLVKKITSSAF